MFFERESILFNLLDVLSLDQNSASIFNSGRNFNALSFRYQADTVLKTEKNEYHVKDNCISYVPARLDYTRISKRDKMIVIHFETTNYNAKNIEHFESLHPERLAKLFVEILDCWSKKDIGYKFRCSAIFNEILFECYLQNYKGDTKSKKIQASIDYIHKNYKNPDLTLKEIADRSFMSEVYFRKLFKEEYDIPPRKYIINLRIQNAIGLISAGYYSLKEIAYMELLSLDRFLEMGLPFTLFRRLIGRVQKSLPIRRHESGT